MAIDFKKIIKEVSADNSGDFILPKDKYFIFDDGDQDKILRYISSRPKNSWEEFRSTVSNAVARVGQEFADFINQVDRVINNNRFTKDYLKDNQNISKVVEDVSSTTITYIYLNFDAPVIVEQTGLGTNLEWSRVSIFDRPNTNRPITCFCLTNDLVKTPQATKEIISYSFDFSLASGDIRQDRINPKITTATIKPNFDSPLGNVLFDDATATFYTIIPTGLIDYSNLQESELKAVLERTLKQGTKKILVANRRSQVADGGIDYDDAYYCFSSIGDYLLSPRAGQGLIVSVLLPYRNMAAVTEAADIDTSTFASAASGIIAGASETTVNLINNASSLIESANSLAANYSIDLTKDLGAAGQILNDLNRQTGGAVGSYVDGLTSSELPNRTVILKNDEAEFSAKFDKLIEVLQTYAQVVNDHLSKETLENPDKEPSKFYIDLDLYKEAAKIGKEKLVNLLFSPSTMFQFPPVQYKEIEFVFNAGYLTEVYFMRNIIQTDQVSPAELYNLINSSPFNDITFCYFFTNINDINSIKTTDKQINAVIDFLSRYVYPPEYGKVQLANPPKQTNADCFKRQNSVLAEQAKARSAQSISKLKLNESIESLKKSKDFLVGGKEFQKIKDQLKFQSNQDAARFANLKTINWPQMINVATSCIADKETRELANLLLNAVRRSIETDTPILCNIPPVNLPNFPYIALPTIPTLGSLVTAFYNKISSEAYGARNDAVKSIIQGILDLISACEVPKNIGQEGEENAENLFQGNLQPIGGLPPEEADQQRALQYSNAGLLTGDADDAEKAQQIKLFLEEISKVLTKMELIKVFSNTLEDTQYNIINGVVERLNAQNSITKIYTDVNNRLKLQMFLGKFSNILRPDVFNEFYNEDIYQSDQNVRFLCQEQTEFETAYANTLLKRGLTIDQITAELNNRRDNIRKTIENTVEILDLLQKKEITVQGAACTTNPDGTVNPGLADKYGIPEPFMKLRTNLNNKLFKPFENSFNQELGTWFANNSEVTSSISGEGFNLSYNTRTQYLFTLNRNFFRRIGDPNISLNSGSTITTSSINSFILQEANSLQNIDLPESFTDISKISVTSNNVATTSSINYSINGGQIASSSLYVKINSKSQLGENTEKVVLSFSSEDAVLGNIFSIGPQIEQYLLDKDKFLQLKNDIEKKESIISRFKSSNNELDILAISEVEYQIYNEEFAKDATSYINNLNNRLSIDKENYEVLLKSLISLRSKIDKKIYIDIIRQLRDLREQNKLSATDTTENIIRDQFGVVRKGLSDLLNSIEIFRTRIGWDDIYDLLTTQAGQVTITGINTANIDATGFTILPELEPFVVFPDLKTVLENINKSNLFSNATIQEKNKITSDAIISKIPEYENFSPQITIIANENAADTTRTQKVIDATPLLTNGSYNLTYETSSSFNRELNEITNTISSSLKENMLTRSRQQLVNDFSNNPFLRLINALDNVSSGGNITSLITAINKINFVISYTLQDVKCNKLDERLINILTSVKADIMKAASDPCFTPNILPDGRVQNSPTNIAQYMAAYNAILRLYAIEYNFKLIAFNRYLPYINLDILYFGCYAAFINDARLKFGVQFVNEMFSFLASEYIRITGIQNTSADLFIEEEDNKRKVFFYFFKKKHFQETAKIIQKILKRDNNRRYITDYFREQIALERHEEKLKVTTTIADYEFFRNINSFLNGSKNNLYSSIEIHYNDGITNGIFTNATEAAQQISDLENFINSLQKFIPIEKTFSQSYYQYIDTKKQYERLVARYVGGDTVAVELQQTENLLADLNKQLITSINDINKVILDEFIPFFNLEVGNLTREASDSPQARILLGIFEVIRDYELVFLRATGIGSNSSPLSNILDINSDLAKYEKLFDDIRSYYANIRNDIFIFIEGLQEENKRKYTLVCKLQAGNDNLNNFVYYKSELTEKEVFNFVKLLIYPKQKLLEANKIYNDIFEYVISLDEIYSNIITTYLLSAVSIKKYSNEFDVSKSKLKDVLQILKSTNDYNFEPDIDFASIARTAITTSAKFALKSLKAAAAASDLNVGLSDRITKLYAAGVVVAAQNGVDIPIKNIPLLAPSLGLTFSGIPPISELAKAAVLASAAEDTSNLLNDYILSDILKDFKKTC